MSKNLLSCIVFFENGKPKNWRYVSNLKTFVQFLNRKHSGWKYCNVYEKKTRSYLKRVYPNSSESSFIHNP